jgi:hypothetical protein
MLSLESIEQQLENPKAYYVFHQTTTRQLVGKSTGRNVWTAVHFANNYKAWLYEEKLNHGEALWTEYDTVPSDRRESIMDRLLLDLEFVLEKDTEELVVRDAIKQSYKKAVKAMLLSKTTRKNEIRRGGSTSRVGRNGLVQQILRAEFKGWSDSGHKALEQLTMVIKNNVQSGTYHAIWENAFQEEHVEQKKTKKSKEEAVEKYVVNTTWEL